MFAGRPIIGIVGGIGSGKSHVARLFGDLGCLVIDADAQVRRAYQDPRVLVELRAWWGGGVFHPDGRLDRAAVARKVFADPAERVRLELFVHPIVADMRDDAMRAAVAPPNDPPVAFVWDTPLLFEAGQRAECDAVVFVDAPDAVRLDRVRRTRGWDAAELRRRENLQWPLDKKRTLSDDVILNNAEAAPHPAADAVRNQVRHVLSRILARTSTPTGLE